MTVAAGFRFNDGIILCADSEESTGTSIKVSVPKIEVIDKTWSKFVLTGAGDSDLVNRAFEDINDQLGARLTHDGIRNVVESVMANIQDRYIYPVQGEKPFVQIIVGFHTVKGADFVKVSGRASVRPPGYEVIGYGLLHAGQLMSRLYRPGMSEPEAILLAVYLLQQTKRYVPYCGGPSRICILRLDGKVEWVSSARMLRDEHYADRFDEAFAAPFFAAVRGDVSEEKFSDLAESVKFRLNLLRKTIQTSFLPLRHLEGAPATPPRKKAVKSPTPSAPPPEPTRKAAPRVRQGSKRGR